MSTYKIFRSFQNDDKESETIATGLTLQEAQAHCKDPESCSRTCTSAESQAITDEHGPWFDGYTEE